MRLKRKKTDKVDSVKDKKSSDQNRLSDYVGLSSDCFWELKPDLTIQDMSKQVSYLTKHDHTNLIGQPMGFGLISTITDKGWERYAQIAREEQKPYSFNFSVKTPNQGVVHINATITAVFNDNGVLEGYRGIFRDITIEVNNSLNAELIEKRLTDTIECIPYGIALFDEEDKLVFANSKHRDVFPEMEDVIEIGTKFEDIVRIAAERGLQNIDDHDIDKFVRKRMSLHKNGYGTREIQLTSDRWVEMTEHETAEDGTVISWTDLSPIKRREKALASLLGDTADNWSVPERAAKAIAIALGCRWAGVVRYYPESEEGEVVSMWDDDVPIQQFRYDITKSPCSEVYNRRSGQFRLYDGVGDKYDDNPLVQNPEEMVAYRALSIRTGKNTVMGHIFAADDKAFQRGIQQEGKDIFRLIAHWVEIEFRRQHVQRKMIDSQTRFRDFAEVASDWFWEVDDNLDFTFVSSHAVEDVQGILKDKLERAHRGETVKDDKGGKNKITAYNPFRDVTISVASKQDSKVLKVSGRPIFDIDGQFKGYRGTGSDITDMIEAMERATQSERWLIEAIESSPEAFVLYDENERLVVCNQKFKDIFFGEAQDKIKPGITFKEMQDVHFATGLSDMPKEEWQPHIDRRVTQRHKTKDQSMSESYVNGHIYMAVEHRTKDGGMASFYVDITELRENERMLREAKEEAEAASRGKSTFLANISHELRTPLNAIIGFSELIKDGLIGPPDSEKYTEYVTDIHNSGLHLLELINDILDLSKAEAGLLQQMDENTDITQVLQESIKIVTPRAQKADLTLKIDIPDDLPHLVIDGTRAKQIFLNLLSNAVKFTLEKGVVTVRAYTDDKGMHIAVEDTGIGMNEEDLPKAMEAFGQVDSTLARKFEGTGLGLPLTKKLVEGNDGTLDIQSKVGEGTTVTVSFPSKRLIK